MKRIASCVNINLSVSVQMGRENPLQKKQKVIRVSQSLKQEPQPQKYILSVLSLFSQFMFNVR